MRYRLSASLEAAAHGNSARWHNSKARLQKESPLLK
jgi:hypothetical protein